MFSRVTTKEFPFPLVGGKKTKKIKNPGRRRTNVDLQFAYNTRKTRKPT